MFSEIYQIPENLNLKVLYLIVFLKQEYNSKKTEKTNTERGFGRSARRYKLTPDFDAPLEAFKEYM